MKRVSVIVPTNKQSDVWLPLLHCIAQQTYVSLELVLLLDRHIVGRDFDIISRQVHDIFDQSHVIVSIVSSYNTSFIVGRGASYVRNYGAEVAQGYYVQYMDDDGIWESDYIERMVMCYESTHTIIAKDFIMSPTIMYRDTGLIQSQGFDRILWGICWPQPHHVTDWKSKMMSIIYHNEKQITTNSHLFQVSCMGAMGLFAPRALFQVIRFDEKFEFVYEDLDMTLRATMAGIPLFVSDDIRIVHMESPRTLAQRSYVGSPRMVYLKSRNRLFFVRNNARGWGLLLFYIFGFPFHLIRFMIVIGLYGNDTFQSWGMLWKGTWDGFMNYKY